jgi:hypothetical protein
VVTIQTKKVAIENSNFMVIKLLIFKPYLFINYFPFKF